MAGLDRDAGPIVCSTGGRFAQEIQNHAKTGVKNYVRARRANLTSWNRFAETGASERQGVLQYAQCHAIGRFGMRIAKACPCPVIAN